VGALASDESADAIARAVFRLMRVHGLRYGDDSPRGKLVSSATAALWKLPFSSVVPAMIDEVRQGNSNSRDFVCVALFPPGAESSIERQQFKAREGELQHELLQHAAEVTKVIIEVAQDKSDAWRDWAGMFAVYYCKVSGFNPRESHALIELI